MSHVRIYDQTKNIEEYIKKAKIIVEKRYNFPNSCHRNWLESHCDSYSIPKYRIQMWVYEGSAAKGYVIVNYGTGIVRAYGVGDKLLKAYSGIHWSSA